MNTKKQDDLRPLKYFTRMSATFASPSETTSTRTKRINVVIWNAKYEAVSSIQLLFQGGFNKTFSNLFDFEWRSAICSLAGLGYFLFFVMIVLMMFGG